MPDESTCCRRNDRRQAHNTGGGDERPWFLTHPLDPEHKNVETLFVSLAPKLNFKWLNGFLHVLRKYRYDLFNVFRRKCLNLLYTDLTGTQARVQGGPTRSYIYVPSEHQIQAFNRECGKDGRSVEEFIDEVERVLRSRELKTDEKCDYILSLLRGPAVEEVRLCMGSQSVGPRDLYFYLKNAFGEKRSTAQLLQSFYNHKQAEGEDLCDYSHALSQILSS